ncbi:MAG: hypothetical protein ACI87E_005251, partial [Mariniblastus sp.]
MIFGDLGNQSFKRLFMTETQGNLDSDSDVTLGEAVFEPRIVDAQVVSDSDAGILIAEAVDQAAAPQIDPKTESPATPLVT